MIRAKFSIGSWESTGEGVINFPEIINYLLESDYEGWVIMEDECDQAIKDPDGVTLHDGKYIESQLKPLI